MSVLRVAVFAAALVACAKPMITPGVAPGHALESITVTSKSFAEGGQIPIDLTCDGKDAMPELTWSAPPPGTKSIVIMMDDPDASGGTFTHLILYGLGPDAHQIPAGSDMAGTEARFGANDFGSAAYRGPCPPHGEIHRYRYRVTALDRVMDVREGLTRNQVDEQMDGHILGEGETTGTFGH